jgi:pimeloyl-ACP methyl ester carboxylesterase
VHGGFARRSYGEDPHQQPPGTRLLDDLMLYWLTNTDVSAARLYSETATRTSLAAAQSTDEIALPVAITVFPDDDLLRAPKTRARRVFPSLAYFRQAERGGHLPAREEPELFAREVREAFR